MFFLRLKITFEMFVYFSFIKNIRNTDIKKNKVSHKLGRIGIVTHTKKNVLFF